MIFLDLFVHIEQNKFRSYVAMVRLVAQHSFNQVGTELWFC